jgi:O-antigen/teichoic acid export membrane protein
VGPGYELSGWTMRVLCLGYGVHALTGAGFYISGGMGQAGFQLRSALLLAALNVVLSVVLIRTFGYYGAPWGTSIAMICAALYFVGSFGRSLGQPLRQLWREALWLPLAAAALGIALLTLAEWAVVHRALHIGFVLGGRAAAAGAASLQALGYCAIYFIVLWRAGYLRTAETAALRDLLPLRRRASRPAAEAVNE